MQARSHIAGGGKWGWIWPTDRMIDRIVAWLLDCFMASLLIGMGYALERARKGLIIKRI